MKTGRPSYYIPSASTLARDTKGIFGRSRNRMAGLLREYEGKLSFATDAWTSPNHRAFVAVTVHLEVKGEPLCMLLDIVEVSKVSTHFVCMHEHIVDAGVRQSHNGVNLAKAFADILQEFGIEKKVSGLLTRQGSAHSPGAVDSECHLRQRE